MSHSRSTLACLASLVIIALTLSTPARADGPATQAATEPAGDTRYGVFGLLDHRSRYGQYWFPEPFRTDELDVDNELRFDWIHEEGKGRSADEAKIELEKSFGLLTVEVEVPYSREVTRTYDPATGTTVHEREEGIDNIDIGVRHPIYQFVSSDDFFDNTVGVALEIGLPTGYTIRL
jgi:hypothetical protein